MRYYVEGSPVGPEWFTSRRQAAAWAQQQADLYGQRTHLYSSETGHTGLRKSWGLHKTGPALATFLPIEPLAQKGV